VYAQCIAYWAAHDLARNGIGNIRLDGAIRLAPK
jgi:hypothetical protein